MRSYLSTACFLAATALAFSLTAAEPFIARFPLVKAHSELPPLPTGKTIDIPPDYKCEIVELAAGTAIPLDLVVFGNVFDSADPYSYGFLLTLKQRILVAIDQQQNALFFSTNGDEWMPFCEFFTGMISAELNLDSPDHPSIRIETELNLN